MTEGHGMNIWVSVMISILGVIGAVGGNFLLIVFWLDEKIDTSNEKTDKVYEIIVDQGRRISAGESAIDTFIAEHSRVHESTKQNP